MTKKYNATAPLAERVMFHALNASALHIAEDLSEAANMLKAHAHEPSEHRCEDRITLNDVVWRCTKPANHRDHDRQPVATPGATITGEDSLKTRVESSRPRELLASESASFHKTLARSPRIISQSASRDASSDDRVSIECPQCFGDKRISMSDGSSRRCEYCSGTGRAILKLEAGQ